MLTEKLAIVPSWLGDETLYSWAARMHRQSGTTVRQTSALLFGATHAYRECCAPAGLHHFVAVTGECLGDLRTVLLQRTALAAYFPFLSDALRESFAQRASGAANVAWTSQFGMRASGLAADGLRWCQRCVEQDRARWGEARWRLPHQLPGVYVCIDHDELLCEHDPTRAAWHLPPADGIAATAGRREAGEMRALRTVATLANSLVGGVQVDRRAMTATLMAALRSQSVIPATKAATVDRLRAWFASTPVAHAVQRLPGMETLVDGAWVYGLVHGTRVAHPVKWLLLWAAVFADHGDNVAVRLMHDPGQATVWDPSGQGLLWPEANPNADPRLKAAMETHHSARAVAKALGVSMTAVRRYLREAGEQGQHERAARRQQARLKAAMQEIEDFMQNNPACTRSEVRKLCKTQVSWLRRCAPESLMWLLGRLPATRGRARTPAPTQHVSALMRSRCAKVVTQNQPGRTSPAQHLR